MKFVRNNDRLDVFFNKIALWEKFPSLRKIIFIILTLSCSQSDVEFGFSVNKEAIGVDMQEKSIRSRRIVLNYIQASLVFAFIPWLLFYSSSREDCIQINIALNHVKRYTHGQNIKKNPIYLYMLICWRVLIPNRQNCLKDWTNTRS